MDGLQLHLAQNAILIAKANNIVDEPFLSIVIPTYRRYDLLKETLQSVLSLDFAFPVEVLISDNDDKGIDGARAFIAQFDNGLFSYYLSKKNVGMFGNWNQCLSLAKGKYVTILHDDDLLTAEFATQMNALFHDSGWVLPSEIVVFSIGLLDLREQRPSAQPAIVRYLKKLRTKKASGVRFCKNTVDLFFSNPMSGTLAVVMNRNCALQLQGFDADFYPIADYEFWVRWSAMYGKFLFIQEKVGLYRLQQNETLKREVQISFVTRSTELRKRMIAERIVPSWFSMLIRPIAFFQLMSIGLDWRKRNDIFTTSKLLLLKLWQFFVTQICVAVGRRLDSGK